MAHNHHMLAYAAIMRGQSDLAIKSINNMAREMPAEWVKENAAVADGFAAMPLEVLVGNLVWTVLFILPFVEVAYLLIRKQELG